MNMLTEQPYPIRVFQDLPTTNLHQWLGNNRSLIERELLRVGALVLPSVITSADDLAAISVALGYSPAVLSEESSPRSRVAGDVFTSTDYPASYPIQMHCEYSYSESWPMRIMFGCVETPASGGQTPVADMRQLLARMDSAVVDKFRRKNVMYRRNYLPGVGVDWRTAFGTQSEDEVERYCARNGIRAIWTEHGGLRTEQIGPAIVLHPLTGEEVWFNHAFFFNVRSLEPESLRDFMLSEDESSLSTNTYYSDGEPIEPETIEHLRELFRDCSSSNDWAAGDLLLVDNMLMAHGRNSYSGQRRVVVYMANTMSRAEISQKPSGPFSAELQSHSEI